MSTHPDARQRLGPWTLFAARIGSYALQVGMILVLSIGGAATLGLTERLPAGITTAVGVLAPLALVVFALGCAAAYLPRRGGPPPRPLRSGLSGRCRALNSPGSKVPSHGMHAFAQTYAIDIVHEPTADARPSFGGRHPMRDPRDYPSFGRPVSAPAAGTVVVAHDRRRDHRARSNLLGFLYMMVEGIVLQLAGAAGLMGNRVVLALDDGTFVALAHLQRGSVRVAIGDRVEAGDVVAAVGNSGNSSEPHVHLQLMDDRRPSRAAGLPFVFTDVAITDVIDPPVSADDPVVPANQQLFHAGLVPDDEVGATMTDEVEPRLR